MFYDVINIGIDNKNSDLDTKLPTNNSKEENTIFRNVAKSIKNQLGEFMWH
jgi:hypothetical protein